jgi:uncharacterized protein (TIRG00374 family)
MQKLIFAVVLLLAVLFVIGQFAEMQAIVDTLQRGDWRFLLLAIGVEIAWLLNVAASYRAILQAAGVEEKVEKLFILAAAANFVNVVTPTAGMGGMALFITEAHRRGYSAARVTIAGVLYVVFDYAGFLCVLALGLVVLLRRHNLNSAEIIATAILVLIAVGWSILLYLGMRSAQELGRTLAWMARLVNGLLRPFIRHDYLSEKRAHEFAHDAAQGLHDLRRNPRSLLLPFALALSNKAFLISILLFVFMAFKVPFSAGTLVAGFSVGYLFLIVSPTPSGIGVVEGMLTLVLGSLFVPIGAAAVITLAYRGITFWLPLLFGLVAFRFLSHRDEIRPAAS